MQTICTEKYCKVLARVHVQMFAVIVSLISTLLIINTGCSGKKVAECNARLSADWVKNSVIYEVNPRSFSKEGTFKELQSRITELKQLGVTIVCMLPIHPIGELNRRGNFGNPYAVRDYYSINPEFGSMMDFRSLVHYVHQLGLKIIIDFVGGYTAWDSQILIEHPEWFTHDSEGAIVAPDSIQTDVARLNYDQHELRKYMIAMMVFWVRDIGVDGFRCHATELVPLDFWNIAHIELDKIKPILMISEETSPEYHLKAFDVTSSWNVCYALRDIMRNSSPVQVFGKILKTESSQYPYGSILLRFYNNHRQIIPSPTFNFASACAIAVFMFTYPGIPLITNGQENGNLDEQNLIEKKEIDWSKGLEVRRLYERLSSYRLDHPAVRYGAYEDMSNSDSTKVYSFIRTTNSDTVLVTINFSVRSEKINIALPTSASAVWREYISGSIVKADKKMLSLQVSSFGYALLNPIPRGSDK